MKTIFSFGVAGIAASLLLTTSCKKSDGNSQTPGGNDEPYVATTYPKGTPQGTATQKTIGAQGGTLASPDGRLSLTIPAGAVASNTNFSIQAVSNTVPLGAGPSYRLLPEGTTFSKPVTITLSYDESSFAGSDENALDIVYQDAAGTWRALNKTVQDKTKRTLTVQSTHFSDYSITGYYVLVPQKLTLGENDTTLLIIRRVAVPDEEGNGEIPLGQSGQYTQGGNISDWGNNGTGTVDASKTTTAIYKVPANVSGSSTVDVKVKLKNVQRPSGLPGKELYLQTKLYIAKGDFFAGYYDGKPFNAIGVSVLTGSISTIQGVMADGKSVLILLRSASDVGNFPFGTGDGTSVLRTNLTDDTFESVYSICGEQGPSHYSGGGVTIKSFENGGVIAGEFSTTLYNDDNCELKTKRINGSFRAKK